MGIVYHAHYLVWFEIGRTEWCRAAGLPYAQMERSGLYIPVTRVECAFRRRSSYDDPIRVFTRMSELGSRGCTFSYEIRDEAGALLADGATRHIFTDAAGRPRRGSEEVLLVLERFRNEST
jgi:acyl-CoA thioester hydrolase